MYILDLNPQLSLSIHYNSHKKIYDHTLMLTDS